MSHPNKYLIGRKFCEVRLNFFVLLPSVIEESESVTVRETSEKVTEITEKVTTTTTIAEIMEREEVPEVRVVGERHVTKMDLSPKFSRPLLPSIEVDEGGTVR